MTLLYVLIILTFFYGFYNIFLSLFKIPKLNNETFSIFKIFKKRNSIKKYEDNYNELTHKIAKHIKLPENFRNKLNEQIIAADLNSTPELYISNLLNKSLTYIIFAIILMPINRIFTIILIVCAISNFIKGYKNLENEIKERTEKIERELPKFLDFMTNSFKFNKNVKQSLESYEKIAGDNFKSNIAITIADMTTGNYETALKRLDTRVNSYNFSKVIRAIIQVAKGEENTQYLTNLYRESASDEYERLKRESDEKIDKVYKYSKILLLCMIIIVFTLMGMMIYKNFKGIGNF